MRELNYYDTLIAVADDCPVDVGTAPASTRAKPTVAVLQYDMLSASPGTRTQEDVLFDTWLARQDPPVGGSATELARLRDEFFTKPQACLRASPLPKSYGWGLLFDGEGRVRLCGMETPEYRRLVDGDEVRVLKAMRSRR